MRYQDWGRTPMIRVLLADDHPLVRAGVAALPASADGVELVAACADGAEAVRVAGAVGPDVVLLDADMPVRSGFEATRELVARHPDVRVII